MQCWPISTRLWQRFSNFPAFSKHSHFPFLQVEIESDLKHCSSLSQGWPKATEDLMQRIRSSVLMYPSLQSHLKVKLLQCELMIVQARWLQSPSLVSLRVCCQIKWKISSSPLRWVFIPYLWNTVFRSVGFDMGTFTIRVHADTWRHFVLIRQAVGVRFARQFKQVYLKKNTDVSTFRFLTLTMAGNNFDT